MSLSLIITILIAIFVIYLFYKKFKLMITILIILFIFYMLYHFVIPGLQTGTLGNVTAMAQSANMTDLSQIGNNLTQFTNLFN